MLRAYEVEITTDASGDATDYAGLKITGKVIAIKYEFGTLVAGLDFYINGETTDAPVMDIAGVGAADAWWFPRILPNKHTDGAAFTDAAAEPPWVFGERIKIITDDGGATKTGTLTFYVEEDTFAEAG